MKDGVVEKFSKSEFALMTIKDQIINVCLWLNSVEFGNIVTKKDLEEVFGTYISSLIEDRRLDQWLDEKEKNHYKILPLVRDNTERFRGKYTRGTSELFNVWKTALQKCGSGGVLQFPYKMKLDGEKLSVGNKTIKKILKREFFSEIKGFSIIQAVTVCNPYDEAKIFLGKEIPQIDAEEVLKTIRDFQDRNKEESYQEDKVEKTQEDTNLSIITRDGNKKEKSGLIEKPTKSKLTEKEIIIYRFLKRKYNAQGIFYWPPISNPDRPGNISVNLAELESLRDKGFLSMKQDEGGVKTFTILDVVEVIVQKEKPIDQSVSHSLKETEEAISTTSGDSVQSESSKPQASGQEEKVSETKEETEPTLLDMDREEEEIMLPEGKEGIIFYISERQMAVCDTLLERIGIENKLDWHSDSFDRSINLNELEKIRKKGDQTRLSQFISPEDIVSLTVKKFLEQTGKTTFRILGKGHIKVGSEVQTRNSSHSLKKSEIRKKILEDLRSVSGQRLSLRSSEKGDPPSPRQLAAINTFKKRFGVGKIFDLTKHGSKTIDLEELRKQGFSAKNLTSLAKNEIRVLEKKGLLIKVDEKGNYMIPSLEDTKKDLKEKKEEEKVEEPISTASSDPTVQSESSESQASEEESTQPDSQSYVQSPREARGDDSETPITPAAGFFQEDKTDLVKTAGEIDRSDFVRMAESECPCNGSGVRRAKESLSKASQDLRSLLAQDSVEAISADCLEFLIQEALDMLVITKKMRRLTK